MSTQVARLTIALYLLSGCSAPPAHAQDGDLTPKQVAQKFLPAVVKIETFDPAGKATGSGTGFAVRPDGIVITNFHVIANAHSAQALTGNGGGRVSVLGAIEIDRERDFAILKLQAVDLPTVRMGNSDRAESGDEVIALGAPLGLEGTVSTGIVSNVRDWKNHRVVQHTAAISPGSSGGPLLNRSGEVIGVNTFLLTGGNSLFFALPVNYVRASLDNSDGKWVSLPYIQQALAKQAASERKELITKLFVPYRDPEALFSVMTPRAWRVERSEYEDPDARHVVVMFSSEAAEQAKLQGWLSEGIRIHLRMPPRGQTWNPDEAEAWRDSQFDGLLRAYTSPSTGKRQLLRLGKLQAWEQLIAGTSEAISRKELAVVLVSADSRCLLTVEMVAPEDQKEVLEATYQVLKETFTAGWTEQ